MGILDSPGKQAVDQRIVTDLERFWDHYQSKTLPALYDYAMRLTKGKPRADDAPTFGELVIRVALRWKPISLRPEATGRL